MSCDYHVIVTQVIMVVVGDMTTCNNVLHVPLITACLVGMAPCTTEELEVAMDTSKWQ